jgi:hypothetical protein
VVADAADSPIMTPNTPALSPAAAISMRAPACNAFFRPSLTKL